mmetsp:Transcript_40787/g.129610  ORF Transcript_40787/g.129610 Transcript_40787/m.129610 type:complete len:213 (+) Transcript_40787:155-793(+)
MRLRSAQPCWTPSGRPARPRQPPSARARHSRRRPRAGPRPRASSGAAARSTSSRTAAGRPRRPRRPRLRTTRSSWCGRTACASTCGPPAARRRASTWTSGRTAGRCASWSLHSRRARGSWTCVATTARSRWRRWPAAPARSWRWTPPRRPWRSRRGTRGSTAWAAASQALGAWSSCGLMPRTSWTVNAGASGSTTLWSSTHRSSRPRATAGP